MAYVDRDAHNELYANSTSASLMSESCSEYAPRYEAEQMSPFFAGGSTKGYVRGLATRALLSLARNRAAVLDELTVLDTGCGKGELSVYLACRGFRVVGVDLSEVGCAVGRQAATALGVDSRCTFITADLAQLPLRDDSVDCVIGHAALHHFIKYEGCSAELYRVMKADAEGFFADSFGENAIFALFHDRERMKRLGDVPLTRELIYKFFDQFDVTLEPTDWFVMLDKLYLRVFSGRGTAIVRRLSRLHFVLDRLVPKGSSWALALSGSVFTRVQKSSTTLPS